MNKSDLKSQLIEELQTQIANYDSMTKTLLSLVGCKDYLLHQRELKIKELEEENNRLRWQFPSPN